MASPSVRDSTAMPTKCSRRKKGYVVSAVPKALRSEHRLPLGSETCMERGIRLFPPSKNPLGGLTLNHPEWWGGGRDANRSQKDVWGP